MPALQVERLAERYVDLKAVEGASFAVDGKELFGILSLNEAGKTKAADTIEGLRQDDAGLPTTLGLVPLPEEASARADQRARPAVLIDPLVA